MKKPKPDMRQALAQLQAAVKLDRSNVEYRKTLAKAMIDIGQYAGAVKLARRGVRMNPRSRQGLLLLGDAYFNLLRYQKALAAWQRSKGFSGSG